MKIKIKGYIPQKDIEVNYSTDDKAVALARFKKRYPKAVISTVNGEKVIGLPPQVTANQNQS